MDNALGIPLPIPVKGNPAKDAFVYIIGFLAIEAENRIFVSLRVFGNLPGLIISTRLSKIKTWILELI